MVAKETGIDKAKGLSHRPIYRIDIPANRYDLLCAEGLSRALKVFTGVTTPPVYKILPPFNGKHHSITVKPEVSMNFFLLFFF